MNVIYAKCGAKLVIVFHIYKSKRIFSNWLHKKARHKMRRAPQLLCNNYKFGLIELHSEIGGTMFNVTNSSRILHK